MMFWKKPYPSIQLCLLMPVMFVHCCSSGPSGAEGLWGEISKKATQRIRHQSEG